MMNPEGVVARDINWVSLWVDRYLRKDLVASAFSWTLRHTPAVVDEVRRRVATETDPNVRAILIALLLAPE
jgi:hypothetical protein